MLKILRTLYSYIFKYKWSATIFYILLVTYTIIENLQPYFYKLFVDSATSPETSASLIQVLFLYISTRVAEMVFETIARVQWDNTVLRAGRDARLQIVSRIHDLDFAYHSSKSTGSLISSVKRGDGAFFSFADVLNFDMLRLLIGTGVMVAFFSTLRIEFALIIVVTFTINAIAAVFLVKHNIVVRKEFNDAEDQISSVITDNLINFETVKLFAKEAKEHLRLQKSFVGWLKALWRYANSYRIIEITAGTIGNIGITAVLFLGLLQLSQGTLTPGEFVLILGFTTSFYPKLFQIIFKLREVAKNYTDIQKYFSILDEEIKVKDPKRPTKLHQVKGQISFKNISFAYPETTARVLNNFSLDIKQGQSIALVGRSGQGKSTIIKLLMRFYDVQTGDIQIDGTSIKKLTKSELRSHIGVVPQEPILFNNTIAYNIGYGAKDPTYQQVEAAAKMASLDEFIQTLPAKYDTNVGERGLKLSGGQKQRLAIARMILSNPDIVVFDEATSHLDSESEKAIQEAFWNAVKGKTAIIVAHRLSTIVRADKIIVIQDGTIAEQGSHRALLQKQSGIYKHFWELQTDID